MTYESIPDGERALDATRSAGVAGTSLTAAQVYENTSPGTLRRIWNHMVNNADVVLHGEGTFLQDLEFETECFAVGAAAVGTAAVGLAALGIELVPPAVAAGLGGLAVALTAQEQEGLLGNHLPALNRREHLNVPRHGIWPRVTLE